MAKEVRLNLACGNKPFPGFVNVDCFPGKYVDQVVDLLKYPWPWASGSVDYIESHHFIEHIPHQVEGTTRDGFLLFMEEVHRVLKPGGLVVFRTPSPHFTKAHTLDPTHTRVIWPETWNYFSVDHPYNFYTDARFKVVNIRDTEDRQPKIGHDALKINGVGLVSHICARSKLARRVWPDHGPVETEHVLRKVV